MKGSSSCLKKKLSFFSVIILFVWLLYTFLSSSFLQIMKIRLFARNSETLQMGEILAFDWDEAFIISGYGAGETIKQKYGMEFSIESTQQEELRRILFFKNGTLVKMLPYRHFEIGFSGKIDHWFPDTVFQVRWKGDKLYLDVQENGSRSSK